MKFYIAEEADGRQVLAPTQLSARAINKEFDEFKIDTSQAGLMAFAQDALDNLHQLRGQIDNLKRQVADVRGMSVKPQPEDRAQHDLTEPNLAPTKPSHTDWSVNMDHQFAVLPLAHQLHLAATALERARESEAICRQADPKSEPVVLDDGPTGA